MDVSARAAYERVLLKSFSDGVAFPRPDEAVLIATDVQMSTWSKRQPPDEAQRIMAIWLHRMQGYGVLTQARGRHALFILPGRVGYLIVKREATDALKIILAMDARVSMATRIDLEMGVARLRSAIWSYIRNEVPATDQERARRELYEVIAVNVAGDGVTLDQVGYTRGQADEVLRDLVLHYPLEQLSSPATDAVLLLWYYFLGELFPTSGHVGGEAYDTDTSAVVLGTTARRLLEDLASSPLSRQVPLLLHCNGIDDERWTDGLAANSGGGGERYVMILSLMDHHTVLVYDAGEDIAVHCDSLAARDYGLHYEQASKWTRRLTHGVHAQPSVWALPPGHYQTGRQCGLYAAAMAHYFATCLHVRPALADLDSGRVNVLKAVADARKHAAELTRSGSGGALHIVNRLLWEAPHLAWFSSLLL